MAPAAASSSEARRPSQPHPTTTSEPWSARQLVRQGGGVDEGAGEDGGRARAAASTTRVPLVVVRTAVEPGRTSDSQDLRRRVAEVEAGDPGAPPLPHAQVRPGVVRASSMEATGTTRAPF